MFKPCALWLAIFFLSAFLTAETPRPGLTPNPGKIRVACIGDSITYGLGVKDPAQTYPGVLQKLLGDKYQVGNFGDSGRGIILTSMRGKEPRAYFKRPLHQEALKFAPDIVICNLGINDDAVWSGNGRKDFIPDYLTLLKAYQTLPKPPQIFIWTQLAPLQKGHRSYDSASTPVAFEMRNDLREVAKRANVIGLDAFSALHGADDVFSPDGIHPNERGLKLLAESIHKQIKPWIEADAKTLRLPWIFSDHMTVQHGCKIPVWGVAGPGGKVRARMNKLPPIEMTADLYGRFHLELPALPPGDGHTLTVESAKARKTFKDVTSGDIFVFTGQSNMEFPFSNAAGAKEAVQEAAQKQRSVNILFRERAFTTNPPKWDLKKLPAPWDLEPMLKGSWKTAASSNLNSLPAIPYYFARALYDRNPAVPVGIICVAVGGATTESFIPEKTLLESPEGRALFTNTLWFDNEKIPYWTRLRGRQNLADWFKLKLKDGAPRHYFEPALIAEAALNTLQGLPVRGYVFYQGESNATEGGNPDAAIPDAANAWRLKALIRGTRELFANADLPFYMFQLPLMNRPWMQYRLLQEKVCAQEKARICNIIDLGAANDVHPRAKKEAGERLAMMILKDLYGHSELLADAPAVRSIKRQGKNLVITFDNAGEGLQTADNQPPRGFEVAGSNGTFDKADAKIVGKDQIVLSGDTCSKAQTVRFGYAPVPEVNTRNSAGLPLFVFEEKVNFSKTTH